MIRLHYTDGHTEALRWTDQHASSSHGLGVLLYRHAGRILDGVRFAEIAKQGGWISCGNEREARRAAGALGFAGLGLDATKIRVEAEQ